MSDNVLFSVVQGDCLHIDLQPLDDQGAPFDFTLVKVEIGVSWPSGVAGGDSSGDPAGGQWIDDTEGGVAVNAEGIISGVVPAAITAAFPSGVETIVQVRLTPAGGCQHTLLYGRVRVYRAAL